MDSIDKYKGVSQLMEHEIFKRIEQRFNNLFCYDRTTNNMVPDSVYINNHVEIGALSYQNKPISLSINNRGYADGQHASCAPKFDFIFNTQDGKFIGSYAVQENILAICDITYIFSDYTVEVFNKILNWIDTNSPDKLSTIADSIKPRDTAHITIGDTVFVLKTVSKGSLNRKDFIEEVNRKAQHILEQRRIHWVSQYKKEVDRLNRLRKSVRPMPDVFLDDVINNRLQIAKSISDSKVAYIFTVDLVVDSAIDEMQNKEIKIDTPREFKNHLLIFWLDDDNIVQSPVYFFNENRKSCNHLHTTGEGHVCTGTTKIVGKKITNLSQLIDYKNTLITSMKTVNISSCYSSSDKKLHAEIIAKLTTIEKPNIDNKGLWTVS